MTARTQQARIIRLEARPAAAVGTFPTFDAPATAAQILDAFAAEERRFPNLSRTISAAQMLTVVRARIAELKARNGHREPAPLYYGDPGDMSEAEAAQAHAALLADIASGAIA